MKKSVTAEPPVPHVECGNCDSEAWGYSRTELQQEGWETHPLSGGREFLLCGDCVPIFRELRANGLE